jgi:FAD/FMN-containing dehydrogenase
VRQATAVVAAPKEPEKPDRVEGVWEAVRYARHRRVPVRVVLPNGDER